MLYGPVHGAEERAAVLYQAVEVNFLKEVTLSLAKVIRVKPAHRSGRPYIFLINVDDLFTFSSGSFKFLKDQILYVSGGFQR